MAILAFASNWFTGVLGAQAVPDESDRFEVASIRPSGAQDRPAMEFLPGGGIRATNVTLKLLVQIAYDIRPEQLSGGPGWAESDEYTVVANGSDVTALSKTPQEELMRARLRTLLSERFHLALKLDAKPGAGYVMTVVKKGHRMNPATDSGARQLRQVGRWELLAEGVDMPLLVQFLTVHLRGTVVDQTALTGRFDFRLKWNPPLRDGESVNSYSVDERAQQSLITAVREQLGLKLERQRVPTDRYSIERAEKPNDN